VGWAGSVETGTSGVGSGRWATPPPASEEEGGQGALYTQVTPVHGLLSHLSKPVFIASAAVTDRTQIRCSTSTLFFILVYGSL
jgi:hypothetical protein